jgi:hypothetical protein
MHRWMDSLQLEAMARSLLDFKRKGGRGPQGPSVVGLWSLRELVRSLRDAPRSGPRLGVAPNGGGLRRPRFSVGGLVFI